MIKTRLQKKKQSILLISASKISNSIKNDKLIDLLNIIDSNDFFVDENLKISKKRKNIDEQLILTQNKKIKTSQDYILEGGYLFEFDIINKIKEMMKIQNEFDKLININEKDIYINSIKTIDIIKKNKHSIILNSVVINSKNNTWGKPDLIVKGSWICKYIKDNIIGINVDKWYIIDIKSSTIQLINGGEDMSSKLLYTVYKSQIYIYTQALNQTMKDYGISNDINIGFILGKKYKYVSNKNQIIKNSFDTLGIVDFKKEKSKDNHWNEIIDSCIKWIDDVKLNWKNYTLNPINNDNLYPNMKNTYNKNWIKLKKKIAECNKELTLLWYCGLSQREKAWKQGIKKYDDPTLTPEIFGFNKYDSKYNILSLMLKILHQSNNNYILDKKNNIMEWQNKSKWEFFIDFETYNYDDVIWDEANEWDNIYNGCQKIYMCGISWIDYETSNLSHKSFVIKYANSKNIQKIFDEFICQNENFKQVNWNNFIECENELDLIKKIKDFINQFKPIHITDDEYFNNTRLIHWSGAEPILYNKKINEYGLDKQEYNLNWYDLLKIFKNPQYPIIIKNCFGFGLKQIIKKLYEYKEIDIYWPDLDDGLLSSFIARDIYLNECEHENEQMFEIIKYNFIDCKAMVVLIEWMRKSVKNFKN